MTTSETEQELIARIARGDRAATREFYDLYAGYLTAVSLRYVDSRDDARDVLQESFIRVFGSISRFEYRGAGAFRVWLRRIVVNESLRWLKERKKLPVPAEVDAWACEAEEEELAFDAIPTGAILEMIGSLPEGYRTVFNLYVFEEMSHREIASMLGIAESSSASQLHRARGLLAKQIKEYEYER
jgi:RNA polymerase sigma-70 factor (ECF subfamily)